MGNNNNNSTTSNGSETNTIETLSDEKKEVSRGELLDSSKYKMVRSKKPDKSGNFVWTRQKVK